MEKSDQVMNGLWNLFNKKMWLESLQFKNALKDYTPSEIHCIDYISKNENCNVKRLAEAFFMTRSAISKLTKKMINKGLIYNYQKPDNKKEVYFKLTPLGIKISKIHDDLHTEFELRDKTVFDQLTESDYYSLNRFADIYNQHLDEEIRKTGADITSGYCDNL